MRGIGILIIGDEILRGEIADRNSPGLLARCAKAGVPVVQVVTVPDEVEAIERSLRSLRDVADAVIVSGGIGPTHDDCTRPAISRALDRALVTHPEAVQRIRGFYGDKTTDAELGMARFAEGARIVPGMRTGGFGFEVDGVYALPGVPRLFEDLTDGIVTEFRAVPLHRAEFTTPLREGEIAPALAAVQDASPELAIGSYPVWGDDDSWTVRVVVRGADPAEVAAAESAIRARLP